MHGAVGRVGKNEPTELTEEEKRLGALRQKAVQEAWKLEEERVLRGKGTRDWSVSQQAELLEYGKISGFEGQHMKSVSLFPEFAGDPNNIQFLSYSEHYYGAHDNNWKNATNGRFIPKTGTFEEFDGDELPAIPEIDLTDRYDPSQYEFTLALGREFGYGRREDYAASREVIMSKEEKKVKSAKKK